MSKKILFFYPNNPLTFNQGNNARANKLLHYFKSRKCDIDFVGIENIDFSTDDIASLKNKGLINNGYLLPKRKNTGINYLFKTSIPNKINKYPRVFQWVYYNQKEQFEKILEKNKYDYILISYVHFFSLIENKNLLKSAITIVDTHDFFTSQYSDINYSYTGKIFSTELKLLDKFDTIWAISIEEQFIFSQFLPHKKIALIPHGVKNNKNKKDTHLNIDILYTASDNPHNLHSAEWFLKKVYPLLPSDIRITIVGKVNSIIPDLPNIQKITFIDNLDKLYQQTKITICPMLSGTGLKIKVVESLSYGIPVVCNERGVDGLLSKINNGCLVTNDAQKFTNYITTLLNNQDFYTIHKKNAEEFFSEALDENKVFDNIDSFFKF
ncbi:glycosyltransferase [Tenacibaculum sp. UWU-22]|uniref:glycosyltransferase n=1 Tax=Tenacibaculum sp. UWU-22 TaxID=3234187 RepID=UPI0034DAFB9B